MMKLEEIKVGGIYELADKEAEGTYVYVRALQNEEIGFSALDKAVEEPDFSNCGVFWVRKKDFALAFKGCGRFFVN